MNYRIVENAENMKLEDIVRLLRMTYWADKRPEETIEKSIRESDCFGIYTDTTDQLIGFARVISDHATAYYLCDVIIDPEYRRNGLGKALVSHIVSRPEYAGLHGFLFTRDAHGLYEQYGFQLAVGRSMERR